jgi:hypothetical protein
VEHAPIGRQEVDVEGRAAYSLSGHGRRADQGKTYVALEEQSTTRCSRLT